MIGSEVGDGKGSLFWILEGESRGLGKAAGAALIERIKIDRINPILRIERDVIA